MAIWWARSILWARAPLANGVPAPARPRLHRLRRILQQADVRSVWQQAAVKRRVVSEAAHAAVWMRSNATAALGWLAARSASRRWAPGDGREWRAVCAARGVTMAEHVLRMLVGGLPGEARWRSSVDRQRFPRVCLVCAARADVWWSTPGPDGPGVA